MLGKEECTFLQDWYMFSGLSAAVECEEGKGAGGYKFTSPVNKSNLRRI